MTEQPLVSIIIPTYNRAHLISETLDSVLAQTYHNWECIIVDDGSTDNTDEVVGDYVKKDSRFKYYHRPENILKGASPCRNFGFVNSKGTNIIFLDSDDWILPHCLMDRVSFMNENMNIDFSITPLSIWKNDTLVRKKNIPICNDYLKEFMSYKLHWGIMCTTWKRNALKALGGFNEKYPRLNDPEIHIRAMLKFENSFFVRTDAIADSIYRIDEKKEGKKFSAKYLDSLLLFFDDIVEELKTKKKLKYSTYLKNYLIDYLRNFSFWVSIDKNIQLLKICRKSLIISFSELLILTIWVSIKWTNFKIHNLINKILNIVIKQINKNDK